MHCITYWTSRFWHTQEDCKLWILTNLWWCNVVAATWSIFAWFSMKDEILYFSNSFFHLCLNWLACFFFFKQYMSNFGNYYSFDYPAVPIIYQVHRMLLCIHQLTHLIMHNSCLFSLCQSWFLEVKGIVKLDEIDYKPFYCCLFYMEVR